MKHVAAYALLVLGGKAQPSAQEVEKLMTDSGVKADKEAIDRMIKAFDGKDFHELVTSGLDKMANMTIGTAPVANNDVPKAAAQVKEEKKEVEEDVNLNDIFGMEDDEYY